MLLIGSVLDNDTFAVSGGAIGAVNKFLFTDTASKLRWLVVHTGNWLLGHKVQLHPLAIGRAGCGKQMLPTEAQVRTAPKSRTARWGGGKLLGGYVGLLGTCLRPGRPTPARPR